MKQNLAKSLKSSFFKLTYSSSIIFKSNSFDGLKNVTCVTWNLIGRGTALKNCTNNTIDNFKCLLFVANSINGLGLSFK